MASYEEMITSSPIDEAPYVEEDDMVEDDEVRRDGMQEYEHDPEREVWGTHEDVNEYNPGGFHPVHIGDVIHGRFEVLHKLGQGGFGMVWLCHDRDTETWRALKILSASQTEKSKEPAVIAHLTKHHTPEKLQESHILMPLEVFQIEGPNGRHICQVLRVMGYSVREWRQQSDEEEDKSGVKMRNMCHQIAQGTALLHSVGVVHGDLRPSNILMELDQKTLNNLSKDELLTLVDEEPTTIPVFTKNGEDCGAHAPRYTVAPIYKPWFETLLLEKVAIGDFGESFRITDPEKTTGIPLEYAAPEILLPGKAGLGSDIWSLACTLYETRTGKPLLGSEEWNGARFGTLVHDIEALLGPLPEPFRTRWEESDYIQPDVLEVPKSEKDLFALDNQPGIRPVTCTPSQLGLAKRIRLSGTPYTDVFCGLLGKQRGDYERHYLDEEELEQMEADGVDMEEFYEKCRREAAEQGYKYTEQEILALGGLLGQMVKYESDARLAASLVLQHQWFKDVATPPPKPLEDTAPQPDTGAEEPVIGQNPRPLQYQQVSVLLGVFGVLLSLSCCVAYGLIRSDTGIFNVVWKGLKSGQNVECTCWTSD
ncbi:hypothetical protein PFICI_06803 [Pestalotiopsis fici W106-1]|uniref:EKC/KEOPS complex subunit BUD32 n=1 Tax=Pestalotiopsis fici (strain W106-1 / CGMCC3.15140) TaxID=1229662 RepID=W3X9G7_PESFW|nr:uncharacterized protein PFICI_06803 [Pestalotiopsis fici W106-1]ETS81801.1 hypothetical protein PFICI_06803 [Pestalotiopsis fici W106-1]